MKYDFTSIMDRRGKDAIAIDGLYQPSKYGPFAPKEGFDPIPMWIADMNFPTVPTIPEAMIQRARHPAFGYFDPGKDYYNAIIRWQETRNGITGLLPEHIGYANGVLGGVICALNVLCSRGDKVLVHSPTYLGFTYSLTNNGYNIVHSPLVIDENGVWRMDFDDMERKLAEEQIHAAILCSPHNPCGRVWERWELEKAMALFRKYNVYVISDEIWSDLLLDGACHTPTQSVSEDARMRTVAMYAPSKTFNLAGLIGSYSIVYNPWLRDRMEKEGSLCGFNEINVMSMHALLGAYTPQGEEWLAELRQVLTENVRFACDFIARKFPGVTVQRPQGTYMLFLDCTGWCRDHGMTIDQVLHRCWDVGVAVQDGRRFLGPCHMRMNVALPLSRVREAFHRLETYVFHEKGEQNMELQNLCREIGLSKEMTARVMEAAPAVRPVAESEDAAKLLVPAAWGEGMDAVLPRLGEDPDGVKILTCMLILSHEKTWPLYQKLNISRDIYRETLKAFTRFVSEHVESYGTEAFDRYWWTVRQISGVLFRIGTLEYEIFVSGNGPVISVHIPSDADLSRPALRESYDAARELIDRTFPKYAGAPMICASWLLGPQLVDFLPEDSRILGFQREFRITGTSDSDDIRLWVFKNPKLSNEELPENTSLQRKLKRFLLDGGVFRLAEGVLKEPAFR